MLGLIFRHINVFAVMSGMTTFAVKASHTVKALQLNAFVQQRRKRRYSLVNCGVILKKEEIQQWKHQREFPLNLFGF
jgi:hypothetical protein